ncbi:pR96 [rat cytomegalovirus strain Maastricht]|uniref:PR96 n=1 Tax=Rat cytomegalovirus (strain Maastricht) TaxID=79700 RepID=Q9DWA4_RCMVM|nr:pR96 [rat cytomegalovirus strain Maastricht]AAF99186.1 pR96 [rat cytomegalovirus strain Maastricht]WEG72017.1 tegument protein UL14 [Murid betaherpesvirus 2]
MRVQLEVGQKRFVAAALGREHPLVRLQDLRTTDARTRLVVREARRTVRDVALAVDARRAEMDDARTRARVGQSAEDLVDAIAAMKDEVEDLRAVFTSSEGDDA